MIDRRGWMGRMLAALAAVPVLGLAACSVSTTYYRYQLKVEVDTPEGVKTGTSVIEINVTRVDGSLVLPDARKAEITVKGEAVAVDLGAGQVLFALLDKAQRMSAGAGSRPRDVPPDKYPMLVTFGDLADPASVALVDPDNLADSFGEGYALKRISVMLTDDPVTEGIEERLGWWNERVAAGGGLVPWIKNDRGRYELAPGYEENVSTVSVSDFSTEAFK